MDVDSTGCNICNVCRQSADKLCEITNELEEISEVLGAYYEISSAICQKCFMVIKKFKTFKTSLIQTEEQLFPYLNSDITDINLKEVFSIKTEHYDEDTDFCRLCKKILDKTMLQPITKVKHTFKDLINMHFPEVNISMGEAMVCEYCVQSLEDFKNFICNLDFLRRNNNTVKSELIDTDIRIKKELHSESDSSESYPLAKSHSNIKIEELQMVDDNMNRRAEQAHQEEDGGMLQWLAPEVMMYRCDLCPFTTKYKKSLTDHSVVHKDLSEIITYKCEFCDHRTKFKKNLKIHILKHKDKSEFTKYSCDLCSFKTIYKQSLKTHYLVHKNEGEIQMYACEICSFKAKRKRNLKRHMLTHTDELNHKCVLCDYRSKYKDSVTKHYNRTHRDLSAIRTFRCDNCDYEAIYKETLVQHFIKIHKKTLDIKIYKCELCEFQTKYKGSLRTHSLLHKDPSEVVTYKCKFCNFQAIQKCNLTYHLLVHKDPADLELFNCALCPFKTKHKNALKQHVVIHSDISEYKCEFCDFQTKHKHSFKRHMTKVCFKDMDGKGLI